MREKLISILMNRDGMTRREALRAIKECAAEILDNPMEAYEIIECNLGVEPDYIEAVLFCC